MNREEGAAEARAALADWLGIESAALRELPQDGVEALLRLTRAAPDQGMAGDERDLEGQGRDRAADQRDMAADLSDRRAEARAEETTRRAASDRQDAKDQRSSAAWGRAEAAEQRVQATSDREAAVGAHPEPSHPGAAAAELRAAQQRDMDAELLDRQAEAHDDAADRSDLKIELTAADDRARAALGRAETASFRSQAGKDRQRAARDRRQAARDRANSGTDELTGARRRGAGLAAMQQEIDRAHRTGGECVAAYVDVDGLKAANDALGHAAGDSLIVAVVDSLKACLRSYDMIARVGGDEFVCVLPDITIDIARERFAAASVALAAEIPGSSMTVGFAQLRADESADQLVQRADADLLRTRGRS